MAALDQTQVKEGVDQETVDAVREVGTYKYGWETDIEMEYAPKGVNPDIVRLISEKNDEPAWMTEWRLAAFERWTKMDEPNWAMVSYPKIDFQDQYYYARPKSMEEKPKSLDEVDPKLLATYEKLGIPLKEQMILAGVEGAEDAPAEGRKVAVDAVFDSVSVGTTFQDELKKAGVIFCSISEAIKEHPGTGQEIPRYRGAGVGQLLCHAELGRVFGWLVCLYAAGRPLPDGTQHLFPDQRRKHRPVRTHADHCRQGFVRFLSGRLHRAAAGHRAAACGGG